MNRYLFFILILLWSTTLLAIPEHDMLIDEFNDNENICYSAAMIGYDSVINSRKGTPAELNLNIVTRRFDLDEHHPWNKIPLLSTILEAYLWKGSPHTYAIKTFSKCITNQDHWQK